MEQPATPQHDKWDAVKDQVQAVADFLEWLNSEKDLYVAQYGSNGQYMLFALWDKQKVIAEFFDIDYDAYQAEKDAVLEHVRSLNNG